MGGLSSGFHGASELQHNDRGAGYQPISQASDCFSRSVAWRSNQRP